MIHKPRRPPEIGVVLDQLAHALLRQDPALRRPPPAGWPARRFQRATRAALRQEPAFWSSHVLVLLAYLLGIECELELRKWPPEPPP